MIKLAFLVLFGLPAVGQKPVHSLLVPGSYQLRKGLKRGYLYLIAEGALLSYYIYTRREMGETKASYIEFARENATGVVIHNGDILSLIEKYRSFDDYYEMLYRQARQIYPDEPSKQDEYVRENLKTTLKWQWKSQDAWYTFQDKRRFYRELSNRTVILMGFLLTNHLASLVDGIITSRVFKNRVKVQTSLSPYDAKLSLNLSFQ